jgi:hypothetical protein
MGICNTGGNKTVLAQNTDPRVFSFNPGGGIMMGSDASLIHHAIKYLPEAEPEQNRKQNDADYYTLPERRCAYGYGALLKDRSRETACQSNAGPVIRAVQTCITVLRTDPPLPESCFYAGYAFCRPAEASPQLRGHRCKMLLRCLHDVAETPA